MNLIDNDPFNQILEPLSCDPHVENEYSLDYHYHLKLLQDFDARLRHIETHFGDLYQRVTILENTIAHFRT